MFKGDCLRRQLIFEKMEEYGIITPEKIVRK
jgi:hypothetical protein